MDLHTYLIKLLTIFFVAFGSAVSYAQSTSQNFPTAVTTNEIIGTIKARDVGDARLTTYYYAFDGVQGDIFLNLVSRNFNGDIDVFMLDGLQPVTKIVIYSDLSENETGRVFYLRKPEKLLLRVQGRTPNDEAAFFRMKFGGSFVALRESETTVEPVLPVIKADSESGIRVNSVGTIIESRPEATPAPKEAEVIVEKDESEKQAEVADVTKTDVADKVEKTEPRKTLEVVVTDELPKPEKVAPRKRRAAARTRAKKPAKTVAKTETPAETPPAVETETVLARKTPTKNRVKKPVKEELPDPLENIKLVILFKDGKKIERPMSEVLKFSVDKGVLTVIHKDGSTGRYSIFEVARVTIE